MNEERMYRVKIGSPIGGYVICAVLTGIALWMIRAVFTDLDDQTSLATKLVITVLFGTVAIGTIWYAVDLHFRYLVVDESGIRKRRIFRENYLAFDHIAGHRSMHEGNGLILEAKDGRRMIIEKDYVDPEHSLLTLCLRYPDLDEVSRKKDRQRVLSDHEVGFSRSEREAKLNSAMRQARMINWLAGLVGAWVWIYPHPYSFAYGTAIAVPLLAAVLVARSGGLIRLDSRKSSARPGVTTGLYFLVAALFIRGLIDFEPYDYGSLWPILLATSLLLTAVIVMVFASEVKSKPGIAAVFCLTAMYAYGSLLHVNCYYDDREASRYPVEVMDKSYSSGRNQSYYLHLSEWKARPRKEMNRVSRSLYNRVEAGDSVLVLYRAGKLGVPWYRVVTAD
ncbi:hypothetical protein [Lewinella sp. IMCC34191]|uniref:hypothetical protein n=1 Tax=Lewinella sp. IMCC34191 TaxID=2259172 RepID=UPI000E255A86|nr:hypothetical protein [Lewinella sp. IMCC34191]